MALVNTFCAFDTQCLHFSKSFFKQGPLEL
jgi:hypothetical protein